MKILLVKYQKNTILGGFSNGVGGASGNENNVTGSGFVELDGDIMNGNSSMQVNCFSRNLNTGLIKFHLRSEECQL